MKRYVQAANNNYDNTERITSAHTDIDEWYVGTFDIDPDSGEEIDGGGYMYHSSASAIRAAQQAMKYADNIVIQRSTE